MACTGKDGWPQGRGPLEDKLGTKTEAAVATTAFLWDRDEAGCLSLATLVTLLRLRDHGVREGWVIRATGGGWVAVRKLQRNCINQFTVIETWIRATKSQHVWV